MSCSIFVHKLVFTDIQCVIVSVDCNVVSTLNVTFNIVGYFSNIRNAFYLWPKYATLTCPFRSPAILLARYRFPINC